MDPCVRRDDAEVFGKFFPHTAATENSFTHHDKLLFETGPETSRNSAQRRRSRSSNKTASSLPFSDRRYPPVTSIHWETYPCRSVLYCFRPPPLPRWP